MNTDQYLEMCYKVIARLHWHPSNTYTYIKGWWEQRPINLKLPPINYN